MKRIVRLLAISLGSVVCSSLIDARPDNYLISTLYTIAGIMFSIGLGLIVTFNMSGVRNKAFIKEIRINLKKVRDSFLFYFAISTIGMLSTQYTPKKDIIFFTINKLNVVFSIQILICFVMSFSILFFIINFLEVQKR
ncbi:conserved membrane hypothetical protein [Xenorhabdus bovienii str. puntauvense]|uniref:Uncharacterized protein n=1 Tax=Xenorhabdus bovienii str. puntauvense TaxID=1398201 RepID=A0A077NJ82_XENBV|nr:conserved membrane hypothetical protein [Xenorhabdus bovienii str. puntauvense]